MGTVAFVSFAELEVDFGGLFAMIVHRGQSGPSITLEQELTLRLVLYQ